MTQKVMATTAAAAAIGALLLAETPALANPAHHPESAGAAAQAQAGEIPDGPAAGTTGQKMAPGMMGGMMGGQGMGPGMMGGQGMGPGMMGLGGMGLFIGPCGGTGGEKDLSAENVRDILEGHLAWAGNERLKVGEVKKLDDDTYLAEIVTIDDSLVQTLAVDRTTGAMRPSN